MIQTILKDDLPQGLSFPLGAATLAGEIGEAIPFERLGLYMLFGSGRQRDVYDPLNSSKSSYPVLAIDRVLPVGWAHGDRYSTGQWVGPERFG